jgi:hypothetical protein
MWASTTAPAGEYYIAAAEAGEPPRRRQPQQRPGMRAGEPKPCRRPPTLTHQLHDLAVKIGRALAHQVPVAPPPLPFRCLPPQLPAEGKARAERVLDRGIVPPIPQLAVEPLDQHTHRDHRHLHIVAAAG